MLMRNFDRQLDIKMFPAAIGGQSGFDNVKNDGLCSITSFFTLSSITSATFTRCVP